MAGRKRRKEMIIKGKLRYLPIEIKPQAKQIIKWCNQVFKKIDEMEIINKEVDIEVAGIKFEFFIENGSVYINSMYKLIVDSGTRLIALENQKYSFEKEEFERGLKEIVRSIKAAAEEEAMLDLIFRN
jgi:hypothetical protein